MGVLPGWMSTCLGPGCTRACCNNQRLSNPNPNPYNFKIIRTHSAGSDIAVWINYPDCTNFEGNKILVFRGINVADISQLRCIDPHFCDNVGCVSPIARFIPTEDGWNCAILFIKRCLPCHH